MKRESIRFRLTVWYTLALTAGLALFALATWFSMRHSLLADVDASLRQRAKSTQTFLIAELADRSVNVAEELDEYAHAFPPDTSLEVKDGEGRLVYATAPELPARRRVVVTEPVAGGRRWQVTVAESLDGTEALLDRLRLLLLGLMPGVVVLAIVGGNWLSRRALKPVDDITAAAQRIGIGNLSERLTVPRSGDELQRLSETWNSMLARLEHAIKRLSRFTADASHELRTPLAVIRTTAEIAARRSRSAESYRDALGQIVTESERMTQLVDDLLFLARCDSEAVEMPMSPLRPASMVADVCARLKPLADSRAIQMVCDVPDMETAVMGNESAVRRLVLVLVDNAIKYSRAGGEVNVRLHENARQVELAISDSGPGIAEDELPLIFQRFYRGPHAQESRIGGCGLGLSLAAGIAQKHGAEIVVRSAPGKGSTFCVLFPMSVTGIQSVQRRTAGVHA